MNWRKDLQKRLFAFRLPAIVGENPLEVSMVSWAAFAGVNALAGHAPSPSLRALPESLRTIWAVIMVLAAVIVVIALWKRADTLVASGMYLFAGALSAFSVAIIGNAGWSRGGAVGSFFMILAVVSFLRGWWLKGDEARLNRQLVRNHRSI